MADEMLPHHKQALALLADTGCICAHFIERDVPEVGIQVGDVLVHAWQKDGYPEMKGRVRYLSLDDYATLKAATLDSYRETFTPLTAGDQKCRQGLLERYGFDRWDMRPENQWARERLYKFLRSQNKWGKKLKVWHSRLAVIRSSRSPVGEPIAASSDERALFELIYSAGGRMPEA